MLRHLVALCHSDRGRALAGDPPSAGDEESIARALDLVGEAKALSELGAPLPFAEIAELRAHLQRLGKEGALGGPGLLAISRSQRTIAAVAQFIRARRDRASGLAGIADEIDDLPHVTEAIDGAFEPSGELADDASPVLGQLRRRVAKLQQQITERMKELLEKPSIAKFLQDRFFTQREERYVLPVRADAGPVVPGIVHGSSASGATMFVEPQQVVDLNNALKVAQVEVDREVLRVLADLSGLVAAHAGAIERNLELVGELDFVNARALLAVALRANRPAISRDGRLVLKGLRHPLMVLSGARVVPSDVELGPGQALLISGPNAGGKTVCLKAMGLVALMLRAGMHLPVAADSRVPIYSRVLTDIGDDQSLEQNLSTFSGHLSHLLGFLARADAKTLVLLDEIVSGTDPTEGAALAQALLEAFAERGTQMAVTTHYDRLKSLPLSDARFLNASVGFDLQRLAPTFVLHSGTPGSSFALSVAHQLGLAPSIVARAKELAGDQATEVAELLRDLGEKRVQLQAAQEAARQAEENAKELEARRRTELAQLARRGQEALSREHAQALDELRRARAELRHLRLSLRQTHTSAELADTERRASRLAERIARHEPPPAEPAGRRARAEELQPGRLVWLRGLGGEAEVLERAKRDRVAVRFGGLRTQVSLDDILLLETHEDGEPSGVGSSAGSARRSASTAAEPSPDRPAGARGRTIDNTVDVRGMRVEEALRSTEAFVDQALLSDQDVIYVLHGFGSGALRGAIRANLQLSPVVERIAPAPQDEGGDSVTIVWLR